MKLIEYCPLAHSPEVFALWQRTVGHQYPLSDRAFLSYTCGRLSYEAGDGVVAVQGNNVIGFGMVEVDRKSLGVSGWGSITVVLVDPDYQRQGIGSTILNTLEARLGEAGVSEIHLGENCHAFWSAVPEDLPTARSFFLSHGYDLTRMCFDLVIPLKDYEMSPTYRQCLEATGAHVSNVTPGNVGAVLEFQQQEFPDWYDAMLKMLYADMNNILVVQRDEKVLGTILTYIPQSRWRNAGLQWEEIFGSSMGAYGAVGIGAGWRGKGLGAAMCQTAALHIKNHGGSCCHIGTVEPEMVAFYQKLGARLWRSFFKGEKLVR